MLSILIPVYNYNITKLVSDLHQQCENAEIVYEIVCFDDGSSDNFKKENQIIQKFDNVVYHELPQNLGRSKIRNELGKAAEFGYLLFMDCDSQVVSKNYIKNYIEKLDPSCLLYGGRVYQSAAPEKEYFFHWFYGRHREQMPVEQRRAKPHHSFMTNNFLIPKNIFTNFLFDEKLTQYGHEDTIFGLQLKEANIPIIHIDNPLEHEGLETTDSFLIKTKQGIENLHFLSKEYDLLDTRLLRTYKKAKNWRLTFFINLIFQVSEKSLLKNFNSSNINLKLFDFYKLGLLNQVDKKSKVSLKN